MPFLLNADTLVSASSARRAANMPIGAILFDCDGTLVDSEGLTTEVLVDMAAEQGLVVPLAAAIERFRGRRLAECLRELELELGRPLPSDFVTHFRSRTAAAFRLRLRPVDGAHELLQSLTQRFCVASSGPREKIELSLSLTGLLPFFQGTIFSSYDIGTWKPDPGLFLYAARALGVEPAACAVIEDSPPGIEAGLAAGMQVFAFQPHPGALQIPSGVTVIRHLSELPTHLRSQAGQR